MKNAPDMLSQNLISSPPKLNETDSSMMELYSNLLGCIQTHRDADLVLIDDVLAANQIRLTIGSYTYKLPDYLTSELFVYLPKQFRISCVPIGGIKYNAIKGIFEPSKKPFKTVYVIKINLY